jgi:hypothetical protein
VPGKEREAYKQLAALYRKGPSERLPTLLKHLRRLQDSLSIPSEERIKLEEK